MENLVTVWEKWKRRNLHWYSNENEECSVRYGAEVLRKYGN